MDDFTLKCEEFKTSIIDMINNSQLPVGVVYYIFKYINSQIELSYYGALNSESEIKASSKDNILKEEEK